MVYIIYMYEDLARQHDMRQKMREHADTYVGTYMIYMYEDFRMCAHVHTHTIDAIHTHK